MIFFFLRERFPGSGIQLVRACCGGVPAAGRLRNLPGGQLRCSLRVGTLGGWGCCPACRIYFLHCCPPFPPPLSLERAGSQDFLLIPSSAWYQLCDLEDELTPPRGSFLVCKAWASRAGKVRRPAQCLAPGRCSTNGAISFLILG